MPERVVIGASGLARWRLAALLSSALALGLGLCTLRPARAERQSQKAPSTRPAFGGETRVSTRASRSEIETTRVQRRVPPLLDALARTSEPRERTKLVAALGETGDEAALDALTDLTTRADDHVAQAALLSIAKIGGSRAREFLERRLSASKEAELPQLAASLATLGGKEARDHLLRAAKSTRSGLREAALAALATLDTVDVREFMLAELRGSAPSAAASYFGDCVEPGALFGLEQLARSAEAELRTQAVTALVAQGPSGHASLAKLLRGDAETADTVLGVAKDVLGLRPVLRAASIERLRAGAITSGPAFEYLASDLSQEARAALVEAARDRGSATSAISALASRGDPASLAALHALSRDPDPEVASQALCAQFREPDSRARGALLAASADGTRAAVVAALSSIGAPEAESALDALRRSDNSRERREAALLLGRFGSRDAERELGELVKDPNYLVVAASLTALSRLGADATLRALAGREDLSERARSYAHSLLNREPTFSR